jgi:hypothetical protein
MGKVKGSDRDPNKDILTYISIMRYGCNQIRENPGSRNL